MFFYFVNQNNSPTEFASPFVSTYLIKRYKSHIETDSLRFSLKNDLL